MRSLFLLLSFAVLAVASKLSIPTHNIVVSRIDKGTVYYHGNRLAPPYVIEATFVLNPDTLWLATYINRLPVASLTAPARLRPDASSDELLRERHTEILDTAFQRGGELRASGASNEAIYRGIAEVLNAASDAVDSTRSNASDTLEVFWRGVAQPSPILLSRRRESRPGSANFLLSPAIQLGRALEAGCVVLFGNSGVQVSIPPHMARLAIAEIDSLRAGFSPSSRIIDDPLVRQDCRSPIPMNTIPTKDE